MAEAEWIKLYLKTFRTSRKISAIERMKNGDTFIVIWFKLLCLAGEINDDGAVYITSKKPFDSVSLADELKKPRAVVDAAIKVFEEHDMLFKDDAGFIQILNWEKYQNVEGLEKIRAQNRKRVAAYRERQKEQMESEICQYCGQPATGYDHIVATARGGADDDSNKIPCCKECNNIKNDKPVVDFLNNNRDRINDSIVTSNKKLRKYVTLCNVTNRYIVTHGNAVEEEGEEEQEFHSFNRSIAREEAYVENRVKQEGFEGEDAEVYRQEVKEKLRRKYLGGKLGQGVVLMSDEQFAYLCDYLTLDEMEKYFGIVVECEKNGKRYKKKTHYQAILEMAMKDRKVK